jgi:isopenicillin N synthase-like dioxygenase
MGLDRVDATVFSDSLLTPDAGFHRGDPLSDSYFRMFRYAGRDDHSHRGGGGRCFGNAHSDVGVVTVAPIGAVAGLDFLVPEPIRVVPWAAYLDGPSVETWQWIPAEALLKERVANGTSTPDEWIVFVGEAVARAAGLHPVVHRVCVPTPGAPEDDHADILRMSVPFFQRPGAFAQIIDAKKRKKASGHRGEVVMREFFQTLKQRVYNRLSLTEFCC